MDFPLSQERLHGLIDPCCRILGVELAEPFVISEDLSNLFDRRQRPPPGAGRRELKHGRWRR
jgi:hypothetical protein